MPIDCQVIMLVAYFFTYERFDFRIFNFLLENIPRVQIHCRLHFKTDWVQWGISGLFPNGDFGTKDFLRGVLRELCHVSV